MAWGYPPCLCVLTPPSLSPRILAFSYALHRWMMVVPGSVVPGSVVPLAVPVPVVWSLTLRL